MVSFSVAFFPFLPPLERKENRSKMSRWPPIKPFCQDYLGLGRTFVRMYVAMG